MNPEIVQILIFVVGVFLSAIGTILTILFSGMRKDLTEIGASVKSLNVKIAEVINDQSWHKEEMQEIKAIALANRKDITRNKERLHSLEGGQSQVLQHLNNN